MAAVCIVFKIAENEQICPSYSSYFKPLRELNVMAKSQAVAKQALKKLEDQLTCAICLDAFKDPKLLQCFHVYCKDCLQKLVVQDQQGQVSLRCPTCRRSTLLPQGSTVSDLQPAFHIHHLFEIQDAFEKVKEPQKVVCEKCKNASRMATSYCRDCGEFICATCTDVHAHWDMFSKHEVVPLNEFEKKVKQLDALKKVTLYCSLHEGKELELYCETCKELICHNCIVKKHRDHQYDLVIDMFERQKGEIIASLEPVERHLENAGKMLKQIKAQSKAAKAKRDAIAAEIQQKTRELQEMLEKRKDELIGQLDETTQQTLKNLATQKDEVEMTQTQLASCLSFVRESLRTGSQGEVMKMKKGVIKQIREITGSIKWEKQMPPCELLSVKFSISPKTVQSCRQFGVISKGFISAKKSYATGKGLKVALLGENATAAVHMCNDEGRVCLSPVKSLTCELISESNSDITNGAVLNNVEAGKYEIGYKATTRGRHQLHIKVEGEHIKGSPFPVTVKLPVQKLGKELVRTIGGVKQPWGVTINQKNELLIVEYGGNRVSFFNSKGEMIRSLGSWGSGNGQFNTPSGIAVDDNGDILVADGGNNRIQKFSPDGRFIAAVGTHGSGQLQFNFPVGIKIHPPTKKIYVADSTNHRIQVLNPDFSYFSSFGSRGPDPGQLNFPWDVVFDSANNVYVTDSWNGRIQIFAENGEFIRQIGKQGTDKGELNRPAMIAISENELYVSEYSNHRVSVFSTQGDHVTSFGMRGNGPQQFQNLRGIAVDQSGMVYVADYDNNRIQVF